MRPIVVLLCLSASLNAAEARWPKDASELRLRVHFHEALEEGPILAELTLENRTNEALKFVPSHSACWLEVDWKERDAERFRRFDMTGVRVHESPKVVQLEPGQTMRTQEVLHPAYLRIPPGRVPYKAWWSIDKVRINERGDEIAETLLSIEASGTVAILPATPANLTAMVQRYQADQTKEQRIKRIDRCRHPALVLLFLQQLPTAKNITTSLSDIYDCYEVLSDGFAAIYNYLEPHPEIACGVFAFWRQQELDYAEREQQHLHACEKNALLLLRWKMPRIVYREQRYKGVGYYLRREYDPFNSSRHPDMRCTDADFERLLTLKNPALRCLLYTYFPERCPALWTVQLRADLHAVGKPTETFATLLAQLDHPRFAMRETATAKLCECAPAFAKELEAAMGANAEVQQRLEKVRAALETNKPPLYWQCTIFALRNNPATATRF